MAIARAKKIERDKKELHEILIRLDKKYGDGNLLNRLEEIKKKL